MGRQESKRMVTLDGFEFPRSTPRFVYHFPVAKAAGKVYKGTWIAENAEEIRPNFTIASAEVARTKESTVFFRLAKPKDDWPQGLYRLEIRADGKLVHTVRFVVKDPS
jgi:hypothetical protein